MVESGRFHDNIHRFLQLRSRYQPLDDKLKAYKKSQEHKRIERDRSMKVPQVQSEEKSPSKEPDVAEKTHEVEKRVKSSNKVPVAAKKPTAAAKRGKSTGEAAQQDAETQ